VCALQRQAPSFLNLTGDPRLEDAKFHDPVKRLDPGIDAELGAAVMRWFSDKTKREGLELGEKHKVPMGALLTPLDLLASPGLAERGFFAEVATPNGVARVPGRPFLGLPFAAGELHAPAADGDAVARDWLGAP